MNLFIFTGYFILVNMDPENIVDRKPTQPQGELEEQHTDSNPSSPFGAVRQ